MGDGRLKQAKGRAASLRWGMARGKWARIQNRKNTHLIPRASMEGGERINRCEGRVLWFLIIKMY